MLAPTFTAVFYHIISYNIITVESLLTDLRLQTHLTSLRAVHMNQAIRLIGMNRVTNFFLTIKDRLNDLYTVTGIKLS
jgi:hypothetical protein